jgi:serine/threonine protein kinase
MSSPSTHGDDYLKSEQVLGFGVSGHVELLDGFAYKSAWRNERNDTRADLTREAEIYAMLGKHHTLLGVKGWDPEECVLTLEYASNGCLDKYLRNHHAEIPSQQRKQWAVECAEGLTFLHANHVIHFDLKPANILLDARLQLKIIDFGGASFQGSAPTAYTPTRYSPYGNSPEDIRPLGVQVDLFALGSIIYKIWTGHDPFGEQSSKDVTVHFCGGRYPDVEGLACGDIVRRCWTGSFSSAEEVKKALETNVAL